ncbi:hypothetical protein DEU56DRAFT_769180 [Suillus clintonianus]|uniref:uncharacterized protein n=1 Tax=Suillus clintonianus TaxID=1904413 RepID=UPI001B87F4ED|nr:uncharacterized protein DEU56DRAFT_769180 [Suillus clintonianus]KAG2154556.1 hypothetical protein DEU56DRAFT_769180 [Suillus clintonianus]
MSSEKNFWPKLRHPFRKPVPHETPQKLSDNDSKISNATRGSVIVPVFQVDPHKTSEYIAHTESVRSLSTEESWDPQDSSSHGDNYVSSWSDQTGCTTPSANFSSFSGQAVLPAAYPGTCSPSTSGDLQGRLGDAYRHIQNMPPSPISPTISQLTGDPRTYHKQLGVPQHSVINQPMLRMPNLPNPHAAHERSHSQPLPSSFPSESLPVSWTWANVPERSSAPRYRHPQVKAQSPGYPHQPAKPSLQIDIDVHSNLSRPATTVHSSQTSPAMVAGPVKHYSADTTVPLLPQPEYSRIRSELSPQRRSKLIKRHSPAMSHVSSPSHLPYHAASEETRTQEDGNVRLELPLQKRSKLIKRRSPALSQVSSPPHSSYPIASEEIGTPVSSNQESNSNMDVRNQNILPLVRPPSPLRLDMPIHQPWHDRRTNFELSPMRRSHYSSTSVALSTSTTQKASPSTEALASLAWIGASPMGTSLSTSSVSSHYTRYNPVPTDDEIDIYMAMDENLSDEAVVEQLEIIRKRSRKDKHRSLPVPRAASYGSASIPLSKQGCSPLGDHLASYPSSLCQSEESEPVTPLPVILDDLELDTDDAALWSTARRALFCIREIIGTERKYQEALKMLLTGQTANQPPSLLLTYLPDLVRASEALLRAFLDDPSAWGVSTAFMAREDDIEAAMVSWCGVVGNFFTDRKWRSRKSPLPSATSNPLAPVVEKSSGNSSLTSPPPLLTLMNEAGSRIRDRQRTVEHYWKVSDDGSVDSHAERRPRANSVDGRSKGEPPIRRHSVRDLAIQPTQRVMRYVLLYRDLLESTPPTSPSRALVERALEAATRIADRCDRAQDNTAFLHI